MKPKPIIAGVLLVFVLASVAYLAAKTLWSPRATSCLLSRSCGSNGQTPKTLTTQETGNTASTHPVAGGSSATEPSGASPPATEQPARPSRKFIAYYFHSNARCPTCMRIEAWTESVIHSSFSDTVRQGLLEWRVVNVEEPGNRHFIDDYQLYTKSVVLVEITGGRQTRWKNLSRTFELALLGDRDAYWAYIRDEVASFMKGG